MHYGFDVGGTKIELVAFDQLAKEVFRERKPTPKDDYESFLDTFKELVNEADLRLAEERTIGIAMCGLIDNETGCLLSSNLPFAMGKPIKKDLQSKLCCSVSIVNDCKCFTFSEANGGSANDYNTVFGAILGTGVGGGLCINGQLIKGKNGIAAEWGHSSLPAIFTEKYGLPLRSCGCGSTGCIERYISGRGLAYLHRFAGGDDINSEDVVKRMRKSDEKANKAFTIFIDILAYALAQVVLMYDPDAIVFGGGLSKVDELYEQLPSVLRKHLLDAVPLPELLKPFFGDSSGVRGAALISVI